MEPPHPLTPRSPHQLSPQAPLQCPHSALALERDLAVCLMRWRDQLSEAPFAHPLHRRLSPLLAAVGAVKVRGLSGGDLALFEGEHLLIDDAYFKHTLTRYTEHAERLIHALLYAVHEVIHHAHNLHLKATVLKVRAVSEARLMEFDLEADHLAALTVAALTGAPLLALKRAQLECLSSFPVTSAHSAGARQRKAYRYISLCAEVRARELARLSDEGGFLVAQCSAGGALLIERAEVMSVLSVGELAQGDEELLESCMDAGVEEVFRARRGRLEALMARVWDLPMSA